MKKTILQIALCLIPALGFAQIPNPDFESWKTILKEMPQGWGIYGTTKKVQGYKSPSAVRIERDMQNLNSPGAVIYGNPDMDFAGGIAYNDRPDSAVFFIKRHLPLGDSAWFLVYFIRNGVKISQDNFKFTGSDSNNFVRMAFKINYKDTGYADSLLVGVSSTDPQNQFQGSFVIVDSVHFVGGKNIPIPNGNFESWQTKTFEEPIGWFTSNQNMQVSSAEFPVVKTDDASQNKYAIKIQNIQSGPFYRQGYIMAGRQGDNGPLPGFSVNGKDTLLYAYYKSFPKNGDEINIGVMMFDSGMIVGSGFLRQAYTVSSWSQTPIKIEYYFGYTGIPDSAVIFCSAFGGGEDAKGPSILYLDALRFNTPMLDVNTPAEQMGLFSIYPNPSLGNFNLLYPASINSEIMIQIFDINGKVVYSDYIYSETDGLNKHEINLENLENGVYYLRFGNGKYSTSKKIIIQK